MSPGSEADPQPADDPAAPDNGSALPAHGDPLADVAVVPVTDGGEAAETGPALAGAVAEAAAAHLAELKQTLGSLRLEGTQTTGVPAVDEALQRLGELDPENLAGSAQVLEDVLQRLEQALQETPQD